MKMEIIAVYSLWTEYHLFWVLVRLKPSLDHQFYHLIINKTQNRVIVYGWYYSTYCCPLIWIDALNNFHHYIIAIF